MIKNPIQPMIGFLHNNVIQPDNFSVGGGSFSNHQGGTVTSGLFEDKAGDFTGFQQMLMECNKVLVQLVLKYMVH